MQRMLFIIVQAYTEKVYNTLNSGYCVTCDEIMQQKAKTATLFDHNEMLVLNTFPIVFPRNLLRSTPCSWLEISCACSTNCRAIFQCKNHEHIYR